LFANRFDLRRRGGDYSNLLGFSCGDRSRSGSGLTGNPIWIGLNELLLEVFGGDLIE
jgi:hypothetical protein